LDKLIEWRFNPKRIAKYKAKIKNRKQEVQDLISLKLFDLELGISTREDEEFLAIFIPLFESNYHYQEIFKIFEEFIILELDGMGGIKFRESRSSLAKILRDRGYCDIVLSPSISKFENAIMQEYLDNKKSS
jgi:hypothetical protein